MVSESLHSEFIIKMALEVLPYAQISADLSIDRKTVSELEKLLKPHLIEMAGIRQIYIRKKFQHISPRQFLVWYQSTPRKCRYCSFTEEQIAELHKAKQLNTKRITTRGLKLEIDRILPNELYDNLDNLTYCCYWCNNAKSDEFSAAEFEPIGQVLKMIWSQRLKSVRHGNDSR